MKHISSSKYNLDAIDRENLEQEVSNLTAPVG
jgi:hypothetical protein